MKFAGKNVLITGGSSGIGHVAARLFIEAGAKVVITGRNQNRLDEVSKELGKNLIAIKADVNDLSSTKFVMSKIASEVGKLDVIYSNAGIAKHHVLGDTSLETFNDVIHTNLTSVYFLVQESLPLLNDKASIVLTGSVVPELGMAGSAAYAASKAGLLGLMSSMAAELSHRGIRVNTVVPGATKTPIWGEDVAAKEKGLSMGIPMGRMGEPEEVAKVAFFLASNDSSFIQATAVTVDGGATGAPLAAPIYNVGR